MDEVRLALSCEHGVWWRNNVGVGEMQGGVRVRFGLGTGSADLVGLYRGRFVAVEIKTPTGRQSAEQRTWQALVERKGGVYAIVRSADEARALLARLEGLHAADVVFGATIR